MTSEQEEKLKAHIEEIAKILYDTTDENELNDLTDVETVVREQVLEHVSPKIAFFLSKKRHKKIQEKKEQ